MGTNFKFTLNWKAFVISFVLVFLMVFLPRVGVSISSGSLQKPQVELKQQEEIFEEVKIKLEKVKSNFSLKEQKGLIPEVMAGNDFDLASAYMVMDFESGDVIKSKNLDSRLPIASLTKVMTAVVALDLLDPKEKILISKHVSQIEPTKMGLISGQSWSVEELLNALLLTSANDTAEALKEGVEKRYTKDVFIEAMNYKAKALGLKNSSFDNPQGFDGAANFSSVGDLAVLTQYALNNYPLIKEIVAKDYQFYAANSEHKMADLYNWNGLLGVYPSIRGVKIGNTQKAQVTTIVLSEREGKKILVVLLGAPGVLERDLWSAKLLDFGFEKYGISKANITKEQLKEKYASWKYWN